MNKMIFTFKTGREKLLPARDAELLQRLGKGTYLTRDMARQPGNTKPRQAEPAPENGDGLDALDKERLHALAKERGVKVHHMAGADKVRAALREAA